MLETDDNENGASVTCNFCGIKYCDSATCGYTKNCNVNVIHTSNISVNDERQAAKRLKLKLTMGIDNIPAFLVKDYISCLELPLTYLFNLINH